MLFRSSISGGSDLGLFEINEAARLVADAAHPDANIIFGAVIDDTLGDEVRVTVIAAGFDGGEPPAKRGASSGTSRLRDGDTGEVPAVVAPGSRTMSSPTRTIVFDDADDDLDIPDFLKSQAWNSVDGTVYGVPHGWGANLQIGRAHV